MPWQVLRTARGESSLIFLIARPPSLIPPPHIPPPYKGVATVLITNPVWVINTRITAGKRSMDDDDTGTSDRFSQLEDDNQPFPCMCVSTASNASSPTTEATSPSSAASSPRMAPRQSLQQRQQQQSQQQQLQQSQQQQQQAQKTKKTSRKPDGAWQMLLAILREDGIAALWQGVMPALILVANPSIQYMVRGGSSWLGGFRVSPCVTMAHRGWLTLV